MDFTADHRGWRATLVLDKLGKTTGIDNTSKSISNEEDLLLLRTLRSNSDLIVTTGATARLENYRASKFAPIAFVTNHPESLRKIPAIADPGPCGNFFLSSAASDFNWLVEEVAARGFGKPLFEGGVRSLNQLIDCGAPMEIFISVTEPRMRTPQIMELAGLRLGRLDIFSIKAEYDGETMRALRLIRAAKP